MNMLGEHMLRICSEFRSLSLLKRQVLALNFYFHFSFLFFFQCLSNNLFHFNTFLVSQKQEFKTGEGIYPQLIIIKLQNIEKGTSFTFSLRRLNIVLKDSVPVPSIKAECSVLPFIWSAALPVVPNMRNLPGSENTPLEVIVIIIWYKIYTKCRQQRVHSHTDNI